MSTTVKHVSLRAMEALSLPLRWPVMPRDRDVNTGDRVFRFVTTLAALTILATLVGMAIQMARASLPSVRHFGWEFIVSRAWDPVNGVYGALPFIYGTVVSSLLALLLAVPVALGSAIFLAELSPGWLRKPVGFVVELLAAIPSVVYGLWGIFLLAPWLREHVQPGLSSALGWLPFFSGTPRGFGLLAGGLILAIMILPTVIAVSRDVMRAVPNTLREACLALGATRWETISTAVLPQARSGIIGAIILGLGRAVGETMAVTMVIGNRVDISASLFDPAYTMASVLANEYAEASSDLQLGALSEIALLLFVVTVTLNVLARVLVWRAGAVPGARRT